MTLVDLQLRAATDDDCERLLDWRNDPVSVEFSLSRRTVPRSEHQHWFTSVRDSPTTRIWVGEVSGRAVGQVRIDLGADGADVAITVDPAQRRNGYGTRLIAALQDECRRLGVRVLIARIDERNVASLRMFRACGFTGAGSDAGILTLSWSAAAA